MIAKNRLVRFYFYCKSFKYDLAQFTIAVIHDTGHASMIGLHSKKIKGYAVLVKSCRVCDHVAKEEQMARNHDCRKNWEGSAKAMEPSMVVEMVRKANETVSIGTLLGDDDTTTIARVCADVDEFNEKCSDKIHVRKSLANELYKVRDRHKNKLSVKTMICFTCAVDQNRDDSAGLRKSLETIIPHTFDDHKPCGDNDVPWCGYISAPNGYRHKTLPHCRGLSDAGLRVDLEAVFSSYITNAEKLSKLESSQANESFNNTVASIAPKSKH